MVEKIRSRKSPALFIHGKISGKSGVLPRMNNKERGKSCRFWSETGSVFHLSLQPKPGCWFGRKNCPGKDECDLCLDLLDHGLMSETEKFLFALQETGRLNRDFLETQGGRFVRVEKCSGCEGTVEVWRHPGCRWELHSNCSDHDEFFVMDC